MRKIILIASRGCVAAILMLMIITCTFGTAAAIEYQYSFETEGQSIWGSGEAKSSSGSKFLGVTWNKPYSIGDVTDDWYGEWGQEFSGNTYGKIGFTASYQVTGGEVGATVPMRLDLGTPSGGVEAGKEFTITSSYSVPSGLSFNAYSPQVGAALDFNFETYLSLGGSTGVGVDTVNYGPYELLNVNNSSDPFEMFAYNRDYDQELRVFNQTLIEDLTGETIPIPVFTEQLDIKDPTQTYTLGRVRVSPAPYTSVEATGSGMEPLSGSDSADVLWLTADATNILAYALTCSGIPVPPLNYSLLGGMFGYNLFQVEAGVGFGYEDIFTLDTNGFDIDLYLEEADKHYTFGAGEQIDLTFPEGFDEIHITPTFTLNDPEFTTDFDLLISPLVDVSGLGITAFWEHYNLIDPPTYRYDLPIDLWESTFALGGFDSFTGETFTISSLKGQPVPEPATMLLLGTGLVGLAGLGRKKFRKS